MKNILIIATLILLVVVACSSPKYTASFSDHKTPASYYEAKEASVERETLSPIVVNPKELISSVAQQPIDVADAKAKIKNMYLNMPKEKRKELRQQLKSVLKDKNLVNNRLNISSVKNSKITNYSSNALLGLLSVHKSAGVYKNIMIAFCRNDTFGACLFLFLVITFFAGIVLILFGSPLWQTIGVIMIGYWALRAVYTKISSDIDDKRRKRSLKQIKKEHPDW